MLLDFGVETDEFGVSLQLSDAALFDKLRINVIDFGFASRYIDKATKKHVKKTKLNIFKGNIDFASLNQLKFKRTSRRDDLISLLYIMIYLFNNGKTIDQALNLKNLDSPSRLLVFKELRKNQPLIELCSGTTANLLQFGEEVFSYGFSD